MSSEKVDTPDKSGWRESDILRALHRHETSLRARLQSIEADTEAVLTLYTKLQTSLPLFANARAGSWYVPPKLNGLRTHIASFKSADGHFGTWALSLRRPNLHVFRTALQSQGIVIFDATRAGKRFPDALTRTLPIWCAAMSLLADLVSCTCESFCKRCIHIALCLPPAVPPSERDRIVALLPVWLDAWRPARERIRAIAAEFDGEHRRIAPLWLTPGRPVWENGLPSAEELSFIPIVCVSVSPPLESGRKECAGRDTEKVVAGVRFPVRAMSYPHVQGAGDDEESWAEGLTPALFWEMRHRILDGMSDDVETEHIVRAIVAEAAPATLSRGDDDAIARTGITLRSVSYGDAAAARAAASQFDVVFVLGEKAPESLPSQKNVHYYALRDTRGRPDHKHALCRSLGAILSALRAAPCSAIIFGVNKHGNDAATAVSVAWVVDHCDVESLTRRPEPRPRNAITKALIQSAMLSILATHPNSTLSRAGLQQITRFFLSPNPSSRLE